MKHFLIGTFLAFIFVGGTEARAQVIWSYAQDSSAQIGSANAIEAAGLRATLRCHIGAGFDSQHAARFAEPGVVTLMLAADLLRGANEGPITLAVDGVPHLTIPFLRAQPESVPATQIVLDSPLVRAIAGGSRFQISTSSDAVELGLSGSSAAIASLNAYCAAAQGTGPAPGFNCDRAGTPTERALCADPRLARLDVDLNRAMAAALENSDADALRAAQRSWISGRDQCGADATCLGAQMQQRIAELHDAGGMPSSPAPLRLPTFSEQVPAADQTGTVEQTLTTQQSPAVQQAPTPQQQPVNSVTGLEQLQTVVTLWLVGERPEFGSSRISANVRPWIRADLPPGYPTMSLADATDRSKIDAFRSEFVAQAKRQAPPDFATLAFDVSITSLEDGTLRLNLPLIANIGLGPARQTALRTLALQIPLLQNRPISLTETQPFLLNLPDQLPGWTPNGETVKLRFNMFLKRAENRIGQEAVTLPVELARFEMAVMDATLKQGDRALHAWQRADAPPDPASFDMADPAGLAELFGGKAEGERLIVTVPINKTLTGIPMANGHLSITGNYENARRGAAFALALGRLMADAPDRPLSEELVLRGAQLLLTPLERDAILPIEYQRGQMNEIESAQVLARAEPTIRAIVAARMPQTPLKMGAVGGAILGPYDAVANGFAIQSFDQNQLSWLPFPGTSAGMRGIIDGPIDFLPMPAVQASALLNRTETRNRMVIVQFDYQIDIRSVSIGRHGPIQENELASVSLLRRPTRMTFFADETRTEPIHTITFEPDLATELAEPLPDAIYSTTGATIIAAASDLPGSPWRLEETLLGLREVYQATESQRERVIAEKAQQIRARTPERFWIGALLTVDAYDAALGGFAIQRIDLVPVAHDLDLDGIETPNMRPADPSAYAILPVSPGEAKQVASLVDRGSLQAFFEVKLVSVQNSNMVQVSGPSAVLLGPAAPFGGVTAVTLRVNYPEPAVLAARPETAVDVPDSLRLTPEAVDLLVLREAPGRVSDAWLDRMIRERLMIERAAFTLDQEPEWGVFFEDPSVEIGDQIAPRLRQAFADWSQRRVQALPDRFVVPLTAAGRVHPDTGCVGLVELDARWADIALSKNYDNLLGDDAEALKADFGSFNSSSTPLPGPDRVFALRGRTSVGDQNGLCPDLPRLNDAQIDPAAPYADLVVVIRQLPVFGAMPGRFAVADVALSEVKLQIMPLAAEQNDSTGLEAAVILDGVVNGVEIGTARDIRSPIDQTMTLHPEDWQAATGTQPNATDILGLTLGMSRAAFLEKAGERLPDAIRFAADAVPPWQYGQAVALLDPANSETLLAITTSGDPDGHIIALGRQLRFAPGTVTSDALKVTLEQKYGAVAQDVDHVGRMLIWGTPDLILDPFNICGGPGKFTRAPRPEFTAIAPSRLPVGSSLGGPAFWDQFGWPNPERNEAARAGLEYCGPVVIAIIREGAEGTVLIIWLINEAAAREKDAARATAPAEAIDLDL